MQEATENAEKFMNMVRRHTTIEELSPTLLREFVKKIFVHESVALDGKRRGKLRRQEIEIYYSFVGKVETAKLFTLLLLLYRTSANFDEIIEKYVEMNVAHPFREGNGRSSRIWLDHMLKNEIGRVIDWTKVDKQDYLLAMERSPIKDTEIKLILKSALTNQINSAILYMKGIDCSYSYEGYALYKAEEL